MAKTKKGKYVIVRTYSAGVFAGNIESRTGQEAVSGTSKPKDCKFPEPVPRIELLQVIEILDVTPEAEASIKAVAVWQS
jgi:hypothetical protein